MPGIQVIVNVNAIKHVMWVSIPDYKNCKCRKKLTDKLIDDCTKTIENTKLVNITFTENENNFECDSCIVYVVLMSVAFAVFTGITVY